MPRCQPCGKFVSLEEVEPEVESIEIDEEGHITASVRLVNVCAQCGEELTEATLDLEQDVNLEMLLHGAACSKADVQIEEMGAGRISRTEGRGRGAKKFYGAHLTVHVYCGTKDCEAILIVELEDEVQASAMESLG